MTLSKNEHLNKEEIIKNGSFFTPNHIVSLAKDWLSNIININDTIIDFGAGYGAFISEFTSLSNNCIATEIDDKSVIFLEENFPNIKIVRENSLIGISRDKYKLSDNDKLFIIGNPPYNDTTSQYKKGNKGNMEMDSIVASRDLGISFMKMYNELKADYICILHPLSYLIKKTNFNALKSFTSNYELIKGTIFSSKEFESINRSNTDFPVILALYKKTINGMANFDFILDFKFNVLNSDYIFCLNNFNTIDTWLKKYPSKDKEDNDLQFYTIRDINALIRNKTFLVGHCNNGIKMEIDQLYKYAWLDYFKNNFKPNNFFLYGNLSPLYSKKLDDIETQKALISYIYNNNKIVKEYIQDNNLEEIVKKHYQMDSFNYSEEILAGILDKILST